MVDKIARAMLRYFRDRGFDPSIEETGDEIVIRLGSSKVLSSGESDMAISTVLRTEDSVGDGDVLIDVFHYLPRELVEGLEAEAITEIMDDIYQHLNDSIFDGKDEQAFGIHVGHLYRNAHEGFMLSDMSVQYIWVFTPEVYATHSEREQALAELLERIRGVLEALSDWVESLLAPYMSPEGQNYPTSDYYLKDEYVSRLRLERLSPIERITAAYEFLLRGEYERERRK